MLYREPAVLEGEEKNKRVYGNLHLQHTASFSTHAAQNYDPMQGADSMTRVADHVDGLFLTMMTRKEFRLDEKAKKRLRSQDPPVAKTHSDYVSEPTFWAHFDEDAHEVKITQSDPCSEGFAQGSAVPSPGGPPAEALPKGERPNSSAVVTTRSERQAFAPDNPFD